MGPTAQLLLLWNIHSMQWWYLYETGFRVIEYGWIRTYHRNVVLCEIEYGWIRTYQRNVVLCECCFPHAKVKTLVWRRLSVINFTLVLHWLNGPPDIHKKIIFFLTVSVSSSLNSSCLWRRGPAFITEFAVCLSHSAEGELQDLWCRCSYTSAFFQRSSY